MTQMTKYLCVSADPRRSGSAEGGENFIFTSKELRLSLQAQCEQEDQTVWMTTTQGRFPDDFHRRRARQRPRPSAGETYGQMSSPGDIGLLSPETTGTVNGRPSPINGRK